VSAHMHLFNRQRSPATVCLSVVTSSDLPFLFKWPLRKVGPAFLELWISLTKSEY
jgi:hypothetical protein